MAKKFTSMAGMTGNYRITLVDQEPVEVHVIGADILRWEQNNGVKSFFEGEVGLSRLSYVAWAAMRRTGVTGLTLADFMKSFVDLEAEDDKDDEDEDEEDAQEGDDGVELPDPSEGDTTAW